MSGLFLTLFTKKKQKNKPTAGCSKLIFYIYHSSVMFEMMTGLKGPSN